MTSSSSRPELWLVRHGETDWSLSGAHTGRTDIGLTDRGRESAKQVRDFLAQDKFSLVLSSPLRRALETCRIAGFGDFVQIEPNLREWDYGIYEGRTTKEIRIKEPDWFVWTSQIPEGESIDDVGRRADLVIGRALASAGNVLIFSHGHMLRILAARWLGLMNSSGRFFALDTGSLSILGWERENRVIRLWNRSLISSTD